MAANTQDLSTRRAIWWTRSFERPLRNAFAQSDQGTPDEMQDLLEQADRRLSTSPAPPSKD